MENASSGRGVVATFHSSDPLLNRIYNTSMWTMANLVTGGMSVDCQHRERMGYIGDAHTTLETALQNLASGAFYTKWLQDIQDVQGFPAHTQQLPDHSGYIPHTAPTIDGGGGPGWSGFVITMPWQFFLTYGDKRLIRSAFPNMVRLLQFWNQSVSTSDGLVHDWGVQGGKVVDEWAFLGDWLTPHGSEWPPVNGKEVLLFNNCYILYCIRIVANVSRALSDEASVAKYDRTASALASAIHTKFFVPAASAYLDTRQTHLVMPLIAGVVPIEYRDAVWSMLRSEIVDRQGGHLDTGMHGTYFMSKLLTDTSFGFGGEDALIYTIATNPTAPGYTDLLKKGYTTWPEAWGTCNNPTLQPYKCAASNWTSGSLSPTHGTLNGIGQWFVPGLGGIRRMPGHVGFQRFELRPAYDVAGVHMAIPLSVVSASYLSPYGEIRSEWRVRASMVEYNVTVPLNSVALVYLPADDASAIRESGKLASRVSGVRLVQMVKPSGSQPVQAVFEVGSGQYRFSATSNSAMTMWI